MTENTCKKMDWNPSKFDKLWWKVEAAFRWLHLHIVGERRYWGHGRNKKIFGRCRCGMWTSVSDTHPQHDLDITCACGRKVEVWFQVKDCSNWWLPWTWGDYQIIVRRKGSSIGLPMELSGKL